MVLSGSNRARRNRRGEWYTLLRASGDFEHHTLSLTEGDRARVDHIGWRTKRPEDVEGFAKLLEEAGTKVEWVEADVEAGQGRAIRFKLPSKHPFEIYYDMEKPGAPEEINSVLKTKHIKHGVKEFHHDGLIM